MPIEFKSTSSSENPFFSKKVRVLLEFIKGFVKEDFFRKIFIGVGSDWSLKQLELLQL